MKPILSSLLSLVVSAAPCLTAAASSQPARPNILFILADDIGYGDLGCYGATKVKTPALDRLASQGCRFTDAHSTASTCTPTRYALLTGQYAWRHAPGSRILPGDAPLAIPTNAITLPKLLKQAGYTTGIIGKWHLGLGDQPQTDYNRPLKPGPLEVGFDSAFIIPATGDRVPCVYVENYRVVGLDPGDPITLDYSVKRGEPKSFVRGIPRIGGMTGGTTARWTDADIADTLARRTVQFLERNSMGPFFLYLATHGIHVPRVPHPRFKGTSQSGVRGDQIHELDDTVSQVLAALDRLKLADNTLVIFTSDALLGLVDMAATLAALTGTPLPADAVPDSFNVLPALLLEPGARPVRDHLVFHNGGTNGPFGLRQGHWKFISPAGVRRAKQGAAGPLGQLYDLAKDPGETNNQAASQPEKRKEMEALLAKVRRAGRSRP